MEQAQATSPGSHSKPRFDAQAQAKAAELVQRAMYFYWHGGDPQRFERELFKGITLKGRFDVVEACFRQAIGLVPDRLDLRLGLASTLVIQNRVPEAIDIYREIEGLDGRGYEAWILHAAYARALGQEEDYDRTVRRAKELDPERTRQFVGYFERAEDILRASVTTDSARCATGERHAIVVLGYALARDGSLQPTKLRRLEKALELAGRCESPIVVTGGVQQSGVTEAFIMSRWLQEKGVPARRIWLEDQAEDTVGNAVFSTPILQELAVTHVTLVTSASHIRRALVVFDVAKSGLRVAFDHLAERDIQEGRVSVEERIFVYRDLMRAAGLWAYPGVQR